MLTQVESLIGIKMMKYYNLAMFQYKLYIVDIHKNRFADIHNVLLVVKMTAIGTKTHIKLTTVKDCRVRGCSCYYAKNWCLLLISDRRIGRLIN